MASCSYCNKQFSSKGNLNRHLVICKKMSELLLSNPSIVKSADVEMRNKQLERLVEKRCIYCNKQFSILSTKSNLNKHLAICKKLTELLLKNPSNVNCADVEIRDKHLAEMNKICPFCAVMVGSEKKLNSHLSNVHNFPQ